MNNVMSLYWKVLAAQFSQNQNGDILQATLIEKSLRALEESTVKTNQSEQLKIELKKRAVFTAL